VVTDREEHLKSLPVVAAADVDVEENPGHSTGAFAPPGQEPLCSVILNKSDAYQICKLSENTPLGTV